MMATDEQPGRLSDAEFEGLRQSDAYLIKIEARRARATEEKLRERVAELERLLGKSLEGLEYLWRDAQPRSYATDFLAELREALGKADV